MTKAEEAANKAYPKYWAKAILYDGQTVEFDAGEEKRMVFIQGYEQAEKDLTDVAMLSSGPDGFYYGRGYQQGMKDAKKDLSWISVKDRLPEEDGWYFTCVEQFKIPQCVGITYFDKEDGWWLNDIPMGKKSFMTTIEIVDYWMPIPELPKEEE